MDGHSSHVTANVIAFCKENTIDVLILHLRSSHILQPLDLVCLRKSSALWLLRRTPLFDSMPGASHEYSGWKTYIRARQKAPNKHNIQSGWRSAELIPLSPMTVLEKLSGISPPSASPPHTPPHHHDLDISLFNSSPPDGIELRQATSLLITTMQACAEHPSPAKRFTERMTRTFEAASSENVTLRKQVKN